MLSTKQDIFTNRFIGKNPHSQKEWGFFCAFKSFTISNNPSRETFSEVSKNKNLIPPKTSALDGCCGCVFQTIEKKVLTLPEISERIIVYEILYATNQRLW
jgi:hypothetical protein